MTAWLKTLTKSGLSTANASFVSQLSTSTKTKLWKIVLLCVFFLFFFFFLIKLKILIKKPWKGLCCSFWWGWKQCFLLSSVMNSEVVGQSPVPWTSGMRVKRRALPKLQGAPDFLLEAKFLSDPWAVFTHLLTSCNDWLSSWLRLNVL